jgi:hypothetical protein
MFTSPPEEYRLTSVSRRDCEQGGRIFAIHFPYGGKCSFLSEAAGDPAKGDALVTVFERPGDVFLETVHTGNGYNGGNLFSGVFIGDTDLRLVIIDNVA